MPSPDLVALQVEVVGQGSVNRSIRTALVPRGTVVNLTAVPADGWTFGGWSRDGSGKNTALAVTMDAPHTVQAIFLSAANLITNGDFSNSTTGMDAFGLEPGWSGRGNALGTERRVLLRGDQWRTRYLERANLPDLRAVREGHHLHAFLRCLGKQGP